jgi:hypothetical protein
MYQVVSEDGVYTEDGAFLGLGGEFEAADVEPDLLARWLQYGQVIDLSAKPARKSKAVEVVDED